MALARPVDSPDVGDLSVELPSIGPGFARRLLDVVAATIALLILAGPMLIVALAVRLDSRGPALYRQRRIGQGAKTFSLLKFRTMVDGSQGSMLTVPGDERVTRLGRILRKLAIDEVPQLLNILAGHMTLVGPRPQTPSLAERYPPELREIFSYRPGLAGPGVIRLNDDDVLPAGQDINAVEDWYLEKVVPERVRMDLDYLRAPTLRRTVALMLETLLSVRRHLSGSRRERVKAVADPGLESAAPENAVP